ncbi:putative ribonuclease H-like domain-containing protein [Tanacetum coccineum]
MDASINSTNNINTASDGNITNNVNAVSSTVNAAGTKVNIVDPKTSIELLNDPNMLELEDIVYSDDDEDVGAEADMNNLDAFMPVSPIPTTRIHKDHPVEQISGDLNSTPQTRRMTKNLKEHEEPKKVIQALKDPSWIEAMQDVLLQFKLQKVWTLVDIPNGKRAIEEGIDYDEVFALVAIIEAIRLFLAYAQFKDFVVYQMDVKSAFLHGKIEEEALYGLHQALRAWYETLSTYLLENGFQRGKIDKTLFIKSFSDVKTANTSMETHKPLLKDADGEDVDEHMYRSMIGSLMYLTSSRPDIMFVVCVCARFQVNPKVSHLHAVKRIFRYLKGQPKLGLWYPKDSYFDLVAYTDSDYAGASLDRKSTTRGCQFLRDSNEKKLIQMIKIHTDKNVADLLTKAFDVKTVNGEVQLQALVDGKKVIITETSVRRDLQLEDAKGISCLPNTDIFEQLALMSAKSTAWNEFTREEIGEGSANPTDPHHTPIITQPSTSKPQKKQKLRKPKRKDTKIPQSSGPIEPIADEATNEENVPAHSNDPLLSGEDRLKLNDLMEICTKLQQIVLDLENTKTAQAQEISNEGLGDQEDASKQGRKIDDIDKDAEVTWVDETQERYDDDLVFDTSVLDGEEVFAGQDCNTPIFTI